MLPYMCLHINIYVYSIYILYMRETSLHQVKLKFLMYYLPVPPKLLYGKLRLQ